MNKISKLILVLLFCIIYNTNNNIYCENIRYVQKELAYVEDLDLALVLAKETNQKVLLIFSASWCQFCDSLKHDLSSLNHLDNKIICIIDSDLNKKLTRQFKVKTLPTSFMLDGGGEILSSKNGYDFNSYNVWLSK